MFVNNKYFSSNITMQTLFPRQLHRSVVETKCIVSRLPPQTQIKIRFFSQNVALVLDCDELSQLFQLYF